MADESTFEFERKKMVDYLLPKINNSAFLKTKAAADIPEIEGVTLTSYVVAKNATTDNDRDYTPENLDLIVIFKGPVASFIDKVIKPQLAPFRIPIENVIFTEEQYPNRIGFKNAYVKHIVGETMADAVKAALSAEEYRAFTVKLAGPQPVAKPQGHEDTVEYKINPSSHEDEDDHETPNANDPNKTDKNNKKQSTSCLSFLFCKTGTGSKDEAAAGQTKTETVDPLKAQKDAVCKALEQYISMFKFSVFGHHHNDRAVKLRDGVKKAESLDQIKGLLLLQFEVITGKYLTNHESSKYINTENARLLLGEYTAAKNVGRYSATDNLRNSQIKTYVKTEGAKISIAEFEKRSGFLKGICDGLREVGILAKPNPEASNQNTHSNV